MARLAAQKRRAFALFVVFCSILQAAFSQSLAPGVSLERLNPLPLKLMSSAATSDTRRLTASIPESHRKTLGNSTFVAVFNFPRTGGADAFAARPRVPSIQEKDWYIDRGNYAPAAVFAAMKLPVDAGHQSTQPESVFVIDVECGDCDFEGAKVKFEDYSEASFTNWRLFYELNYLRTEENVNSYNFNSVKAGDKPTSRKAELEKKALCSSLHGARVILYGDSGTVRSANWTSNTISRKAELFYFHTCAIFRPDDEEKDLCKPGLGGKIALEVDCEVECDVRTVAVNKFLEPQPPLGASLKSGSVKGVWGEEAGVCSLQVEDPEKKLKKKGLDESEIFRLWYDATEGCKTTSSDSETFDYSLYWNSRQQVHDLEEQLNNATAARDRLEGVGKCVCERLKGRVYRLLDGGPVDQYTPRSFTVPPPNDRGPATAVPRNSPKGSEATEDEAGHDNESETGENRHTRTDPPANPPKNSGATGDHPRPDDRSATDHPMTRNPVTTGAASPVGSTSQGAVSIEKLLFNIITGKTISEGHLVFENWISKANSEPDVPFVIMLCLSLKGSSGGSSIQSVSLEGEGELKRFQTPEDSNYACYAFDACDAWKAGYPERLPKITVVGKNVSEKLRWRLDEAIPFGNSSSSEIRIGRGGQYGSVEQRKRLQGVEKLVETKLEKTSSSVRCVDAPSKIRGSQTSGAEPGEVASAFYVRPPYQLDPNVTLSYSGDGRSLSVSAFLGAFVVLALHYLQGRS